MNAIIFHKENVKREVAILNKLKYSIDIIHHVYPPDQIFMHTAKPMVQETGSR